MISCVSDHQLRPLSPGGQNIEKAHNGKRNGERQRRSNSIWNNITVPQQNSNNFPPEQQKVVAVNFRAPSPHHNGNRRADRYMTANQASLFQSLNLINRNNPVQFHLSRTKDVSNRFSKTEEQSFQSNGLNNRGVHRVELTRNPQIQRGSPEKGIRRSAVPR